MSYTLISYNVFGSPFFPQKIIRSFFRTKVRKRFRKIAQEILQENIDFLLFQEVHTYPHFLVLRRALRKYKYVFYWPGLFGPKGGLVIFSHYPLEKKRYQDFDRKGDWWNKTATGPISQKGILYCKMKDHNLWLVNTHLTQNSSQSWNIENRSIPLLQSQLKQCTTLVNSLKNKNYSIILAGDFNTPHTLNLYTEFKKNTGLSDCFEGISEDTYYTNFQGLDSNGRIDYIFFDKKTIKITDKKYRFTEPLKISPETELYLSDHVALKATFSLL